MVKRSGYVSVKQKSTREQQRRSRMMLLFALLCRGMEGETQSSLFKRTDTPPSLHPADSLMIL